MPDVVILMTPAASGQMSDSVWNQISQEVAHAVRDILGLPSVQNVVCYELVAGRTLHANPIQILCIASKSDTRLAKLTELRDAILNAVKRLEGNADCAKYFEIVGTIESWPIMPDGSWGEVSVAKT